MLLAIFLVSLLAISAVSANDLNNTYDIVSEEVIIDDNLEMSSDEVISTAHTVSGNTFEDIQNSIDSANDDDTIVISGTYTGKGTEIQVDKSLTFEGRNDATLDAKGLSRMFFVKSNNVIFKNIKFINGCAANQCGGTILAGYRCEGLSVVNCIFENNSADAGGAIDGGNAIGCTFSNNHANSSGGAIWEGNAINCTFNGNTAFTGGAIREGYAINCSFTNNAVKGEESRGGAIWFYGTWDTSAINCTFINNSAYTCGAVGGGKMFNCIFINNTAIESGGAASGGLCENCIFINNSARIGGATYRGDNLVNSTFINNHAVEGGAVYAYDDVIDSCKFNCNTAELGGAIRTYQLDDTLASVVYHVIINNCDFNNNNASSMGGAISAYTRTDVYNSRFREDNDDGYFIYFNPNKYAPYHNAKLDLKNNTMESDEYYKIYYATGRTSDFGAYLIFENITDSDGNKIICGLFDDNGNRISISGDDFEVQFINLETSVVTRDWIYGYKYNLDYLLDGSYRMTADKPDFGERLSNVSVIDGFVTINRIDFEITGIYTYYGNEEVCRVGLYKSENPIVNAKVRLTVNGTEYNVTTGNDGQATLKLLLDPGEYEVGGEYDGHIVYDDIIILSSIEVENQTGIYQKSSVSAKVLNELDMGAKDVKVVFQIEGKNYTATSDTNGIAQTNVNLDVGSYDVDVIRLDNREKKRFKLTITKSSSSIYLGAIQSRNIITLTATLTPKTDSGNVVFNVNGENRNVQINNGKATLTLKDLEPGNYTVTASYNGDKNLNASTSNAVTFSIAEVYPILTAKDLTKTYGTSNKFVVNLVDSKGNAIPNAVVNVDIKGKITPITTGSNGQATMPINLAPATYTATVTYGNDAQATAKITVKKATPKLTAKAKTFKKSLKTKKYTVTLKTNKNKVMKKVWVSLKVNKKTYKVKTNNKGQATFKITNLKKKGRYTAVVKYAGSKYYTAKTVKPKITIK